MRTKVIGQCKTCHWFLPEGYVTKLASGSLLRNTEDECDNRKVYEFVDFAVSFNIKNFGCWYWKAKK